MSRKILPFTVTFLKKAIDNYRKRLYNVIEVTEYGNERRDNMTRLERELQKKQLKPYIAIMAVLNCTEKTARKKLKKASGFTVSEAIKIINTYFKGEGLTVEELFVGNQAS